MPRSSRTESLYDRVRALPLTVEGVSLTLNEQATSSGWTRCATTIALHGGGHVGRGEDVTYDGAEQKAFAGAPPPELAGRYPSFDEYSRALDRLGTLFDGEPGQASSVLYRRWALESAGLDLALRQAETNLAERCGLTPRPVRFAVSTGLGTPPTTAPLLERQRVAGELEFKIDYAEGFTDALLDELRGLRIACVDFKGHYHGAFSGPPVDVDRYRAVARALPEAILEDPGFAGLDAVREFAPRLSWDYPVRSVADLLLLPETGWINIKPSRFGLVSELLRAIEFCQARDLGLYGGGQFELGVGRTQAQELASLFYADGPNDLAPPEYNDAVLAPGVPTSPLALANGPGFGAAYARES